MSSLLQKKRTDFVIHLPDGLKDLIIEKKAKTTSLSDTLELEKLFPKTFGQEHVVFQKGLSDKKSLRIGVVFSGGQASGGHNVIAGLFDHLESIHSDCKLLGFLNGPSGICNNEVIEISKDLLKSYRNQGGFDLIGSGRTKIETKEQLSSALSTAKIQALDGIVIIGGDDSNTNAAVLAEYFLQNGCDTRVVGVPKTIDGDLRAKNIEISFGFDTACKTYSEMIGNIQRDAISAKKYFHFIRLMGRSASHIALECAHQTHPNFTLISEEVAQKNKTLSMVIKEICDMICIRAKNGKNYGVVLIPEGLIEFVPEIRGLIEELNSLLASDPNADKQKVEKGLSDKSKNAFGTLPQKIQDQLLLTRDPHGNVQVSHIETEKLIIELVKTELKIRTDYKGKFNPISHFFGYEGRAAMPSNFDARYCYCLGTVAATLIQNGLTGYLSAITDLKKPFANWQAAGIPITSLMNLEMRHGKKKPVIKKALVDLEGEFFKTFFTSRVEWGKNDHYIYPGPIQYFGDTQVTDSVPVTI